MREKTARYIWVLGNNNCDLVLLFWFEFRETGGRCADSV